MRSFLIFLIFFSGYMIVHNYFSIFYIKLLAFIALQKNRPVKKSDFNKVSIILPAYNEEKIIYEKLKNIKDGIANVHLPVIEVLIGSDGSTDSTCNIVRSFIHENSLTNWKLYEFSSSGKGSTINKLVANSAGELIISTDVDVLADKNAIAEIINAFHCDKQLGCLSCIPVFSTEDVESQNIYWNQDIAFRRNESKLGMLVVVTGWLYGFRKRVFRQIPQGVMADDLWIPLTILLQGYRCIQDDNLKVLSEKTDEQTEIARRKRVITGGMDVVKRLMKELLKKPLLFFLVFSHKINRWLLPFWVSLLAVSTIFLHYYFVFFYAIVGILLIIILKPRRFFSYLYALYSPVFSFVQVLTAGDHSKWEHLRK